MITTWETNNWWPFTGSRFATICGNKFTVGQTTGYWWPRQLTSFEGNFGQLNNLAAITWGWRGNRVSEDEPWSVGDIWLWPLMTLFSTVSQMLTPKLLKHFVHQLSPSSTALKKISWSPSSSLQMVNIFAITSTLFGHVICDIQKFNFWSCNCNWVFPFCTKSSLEYGCWTLIGLDKTTLNA